LRFLQETVHKEYTFLFKKTTAEAFNAKVEALHKAIPSLQEHEIIVGLARIVSSFEYGHTALSLRNDVVKQHQLPINLYHYSDGVFIQAAHKEYAQAVGAKITHIEEMPIEDALKAVRPVVPAENDQFYKAYGINYLSIPEVLHAQGVSKSLSNTVTFTLQKKWKNIQTTFCRTKRNRKYK